MIELLIKQLMPKDFDIEKLMNIAMVKSGEITSAKQTIERLENKIDFLTKQIQAIVYKFEPDSRPIDAWLTVEGNGLQRKFVSLDNPKDTGVTNEDIAKNELNIIPLFTL